MLRARSAGHGGAADDGGEFDVLQFDVDARIGATVYDQRGLRLTLRLRLAADRQRLSPRGRVGARRDDGLHQQGRAGAKTIHKVRPGAAQLSLILRAAVGMRPDLANQVGQRIAGRLRLGRAARLQAVADGNLQREQGLAGAVLHQRDVGDRVVPDLLHTPGLDHRNGHDLVHRTVRRRAGLSLHLCAVHRRCDGRGCRRGVGRRRRRRRVVRHACDGEARRVGAP